MVTISNDFHGTKMRTQGGRKTKSRVSRIKRHLCGISGCKCSDDIGSRGPQRQPDGSLLEIVWDSDSTVYLSTSQKG